MRATFRGAGLLALLAAVAVLGAIPTAFAADGDIRIQSDIVIKDKRSTLDSDLHIAAESADIVIGSGKDMRIGAADNDIRIGAENTHVVGEKNAADESVVVVDTPAAHNESEAPVVDEDSLDEHLSVQTEFHEAMARKAKFTGRRRVVADNSGEGLATGHRLKFTDELEAQASAKRAAVTAPDMAVTHVGESVEIAVLNNDSNPDGGDLDLNSLEVVADPNSGSVSVDTASGTVTYTPEADFVGTDAFTYVVCDSAPVPECNTASVEVAVIEDVECTDYLGMPIQQVDFCLMCWANEQITSFLDDEVIPGLMELRHAVEQYDPFNGVEVGLDTYVVDQSVYSHALRALAVDECLDAEELVEDDEWTAPYYQPNGLDSLHAFHELNTMILASLVDAGAAMHSAEM